MVFAFTIKVGLGAFWMLSAFFAAGREPPADLVADALLLLTGLDLPLSRDTLACTSAQALLRRELTAPL